jgi:RNA polymerase sigma-70 factor (ECF subfamily)
VTDAEVIRRSLSDEAAFASLFDRHYPAVHRFLRARVGVGLADDLASEVFVTAFGRRASYDLERDDARPWLYGIAVNVIRGHRRSELRRLRAYARAAAYGRVETVEAADSLDPELASALLRLDDDDRNLVLLFAWAGLSYEELAQALEIPLGTVRSRLSRARAGLRVRRCACPCGVPCTHRPTPLSPA